MTVTEHFVIVGASLAGAKAAQTLREEGFQGSLVLVGSELELPYERPSLSKGYLTGAEPFEKAIVHDSQWYADNDVELMLGRTATALDTAEHRITLSDGATLTYNKLLLATGASPIALPVRGADAALTLRTRQDADTIRSALQPGRRVVLIGGGWIGLELASAAVGAGCDVTVIEQAELPLLGPLGPEVAAIFADEHRAKGVHLLTGAAVREITESSVLTDDGEIPADVVISAVGARPVTYLAEGAGIEVDNGIVTDASLRTSAPDVFAAGDVANAFHPRHERHTRVEHWDNAAEQGAAAARAMLGQEVSYDRTPYFFTDQYDLGMEYVGWVDPAAEALVLVRGDAEARQFQAFWLVAGSGEEDSVRTTSGGASSGPTHRVAAAMHVNMWDVGADPLRLLVETRLLVDPETLADPDVPLPTPGSTDGD